MPTQEREAESVQLRETLPLRDLVAQGQWEGYAPSPGQQDNSTAGADSNMEKN